jgi:O-antigen/teichoic acid export membrane protein
MLRGAFHLSHCFTVTGIEVVKYKLGRVCKLLRELDSTVIRGISTIFTLRLVEKVTGFVLTVALFRILEKEQIAEYGFIQTVIAICAIFSIQEFQNTISQSVTRGFPGVYRQAVSVALRYSFIGMIILAGFAGWYIWSEHERLGFGFMIAALLYPSFYALSHWKGVYLGEKNFLAFAIAEAGNAVIKTLLILTVLWFYTSSEVELNWLIPVTFNEDIVHPQIILAVIFIFLVVPSIQNLWQSYRCHHRIGIHAPTEEGAISYGLQANLYSAIGVVSSNLDRFLIFTLLSPPLLAVFMAAEKFADLFQNLVQDIGAVLAPKFAVTKRYTHSLDRKLKIISFVMAIFIGLFATLALPSLLVIIFGEEYQESVIYAQVLLVAVVFNNIATLRFRFIRSRLDATSFRNILLFSSISKICLSVSLITIFGLNGAIASVLLHRILLSIIVGRIIHSRYLIDETIPRRSVA